MAIEPVSALYRAASTVVRTLPLPATELFARAGSAVVPEVSEERRLLVERNLRRIYGADYGGAELRRSVRETFWSYTRYWIDSFRLPDLDLETIDAGFSAEGYEHVAESLARGVGPILVLPHLGGWEWAAFWLTQVQGIPVTAVVEAVEPPELFEFFVEFRRALGMNIVPLGPGAGTEVLRAIKAGHIVCLLADRDIEGTGVPVEFFGETTTLPAGPATLALRTGAPLLPTAVYFQGEVHHGVVGPPLPAERRGRLRDDVAHLTQEMAGRLEGLIRAAPEQWHLQQPNWPSDYEALEAIGKPHPRPGEQPCASA